MNGYYRNINSYFNYSLFHPVTSTECDLDALSEILPKSLIEFETSRESIIEIPTAVMKKLANYRETPLFRARNFEKAIGTTCEIYIKDEGKTPSGNHKMNSAYLIAYLCAKDGIRTIVTETTGNWGIALALAANDFGLTVICVIDEESNQARPNRKSIMEGFGAIVKVVKLDEYHKDLLTLSTDKAIEHTKTLKNAVYIYGSVYGYFVIPQSIIGVEAKQQLLNLDKYPDIVVGSCGGGANLLGTASEFMADNIEGTSTCEIYAAESASCPILSKGKMGYSSIDNLNYYPLIHTYSISGLEESDYYIGGLGSTIVAPAVSHFHENGLIRSGTYTNVAAKDAAEMFNKEEGIMVALETAYQLAGVVDKAITNHNKAILVNISSTI